VILLLNASEALSFAPSAAAPAAPGYALSRPTPGLTVCVGSDAQHALFGSYAYLEALGFTFTSAGPTVPARSQLRSPPVGWSVSAAPSFTTRGLQPFHDFAGKFRTRLDPRPRLHPKNASNKTP
jgi:hypothetical protein